MKRNVVEQELLELEKQFCKAIKDKNARATARLSNDPSLITGAQKIVGLMRAFVTLASSSR